MTYGSDPTYKRLLAGVIEEPASDEPRLILADWLEDQNDPEASVRAEFIRAQITLASDPWVNYRCVNCGDAASMQYGSFAVSCTHCPERAKLRRRQQDLLTPQRFWDWFGESPGHAWPGMPSVSISLNTLECTVGCFDGQDESSQKAWTLTPRRGFLATVNLPEDAWMQHGAELVRHQPIERVNLKYKRPIPHHRADGRLYMDNGPPVGGLAYAWYYGSGTNGAVCGDLYSALDRSDTSDFQGAIRYAWKTEQAALDALSDACLRWARSQQTRRGDSND